VYGIIILCYVAIQLGFKMLEYLLNRELFVIMNGKSDGMFIHKYRYYSTYNFDFFSFQGHIIW